MRYTKRNEKYTGKERKLWELENDIEDGKLIYVDTIENLPRIQGKTLLEKAQKFDLLKDKIENGILIELPCKVGDFIYVVFNWNNKVGGIHCVLDMAVVEIMVDVSGISIKAEHNYYKLTDYNKTWFTNRELAEKKLEELENE